MMSQPYSNPSPDPKCGTTHYAGCPCHERERDQRIAELEADVERYQYAADELAKQVKQEADKGDQARDRVKDLQNELQRRDTLIANLEADKERMTQERRDLARDHQQDARLWSIERQRLRAALEKVVKYCKDGVECVGEDCDIWEHSVARQALDPESK